MEKNNNNNKYLLPDIYVQVNNMVFCYTDPVMAVHNKSRKKKKIKNKTVYTNIIILCLFDFTLDNGLLSVKHRGSLENDRVQDIR